MFGCTLHLRNWTSEGVRGNKAPTHVNVYRSEEIKKGKSSLDRAGMVLVALMSGGDYIPAGIPGCGPKVACEAARAGFGHDLFKIDAKDAAALRQWRERLEHELRCNESGYFRTRHKSLQIPENFPDKAVLYYYIHPVVSNQQQIERYRTHIRWGQSDVPGLRRFSARAFEWRGYAGLRHFVRVMAPALVGQRLAHGQGGCSAFDDMDIQAEEEEKIIKVITGKRNHVTADNVTELRVAYIPKNIVGLDTDAELQAEKDLPQTHTAIYSSDEEIEDGISEGEAVVSRSESPRKRRDPSRYDPSKPEKDWFPETYVKLGAPLTVENWEAEMRDPKKFASRKARARSKLKGGMPRGAIEPFLRVRKPGYQERLCKSANNDGSTAKQAFTASQPDLPTQRAEHSRPAQRKRNMGDTARVGQDSANTTASRAVTVPAKAVDPFVDQICDFPSTMPAGNYSFRPSPLTKANPTSRPFKSRAKGQIHVPDQRDTIVILSSPTKPQNFLFESSQRPRPDKKPQAVAQNLTGREVDQCAGYKDRAPTSPESCASSLPSPSSLFAIKPNGTTQGIPHSGEVTAAKVALRRARQKAVVRESLEGSWKALDDGRAGCITPKRCFSGVEVLDLTAS